jgi:hypothetical protein
MPNRFLNNININDEYTLPSADGTVDQGYTCLYNWNRRGN